MVPLRRLIRNDTEDAREVREAAVLRRKRGGGRLPANFEQVILDVGAAGGDRCAP